MASERLRRRFAARALWALIAAASGQLLPVTVAVILARAFSVSDYGRFMLLYTTASTLANLTGYSLGLTATRFVALLVGSDPSRAGAVISHLVKTLIVVAVTLAALAAAFAPLVSERILQARNGTQVVLITAVLFGVMAMAGLQSGILSGFQRFHDIAIANVLRLLIGVPLSMLMAYRGSIEGVLGILTIATVAGCLINHWHITRAARIYGIALQWRHTQSVAGIWMNFSFPALLAYLMVTPVLWIGQLLLLRAPNAFWEIAVFNIALHWRNLVIFIPAAVAQAAIPLMAESIGVPDGAGPARIFNLNLATACVLALGTATVIALFSSSVLSAYGPNYASGRPVLTLSAFTAVLIAFNNALGAGLTAAGKMWQGFGFNALWAVVVVVQAVILTPTQGAFGLAVATASAYVAHSLWQSGYIYRTGLFRIAGRTCEAQIP